MKNSSKILLGFMLVMMICCVSAVSATDINGTDDALITDDIAIDDVSEIVEEVEIDDASDDVVEEQNLRTTTGNINGHEYTYYFNTDGTLKSDAYGPLDFNGYFDDAGDTFGNFKINKQITLNVANATFNNIGFDLLADNLKLNEGTFTSDGTDDGAVIYVNAANVEVTNNQMTLQAPNATNYIAIDVVNSSSAKILHNTINYTCDYANPTDFNYVIRAKNSENIEINYNEVNATLPLKDVNWGISGSIDADYVAGVAVENCTNAKFKNNKLTVIGNKRAGWYPTLDAFIIAKSANAIVENNIIKENDVVTAENEYSYIYGIDVYSCDNIKINNNTVNMNGNLSGGQLESGNGTGAAYCIQLSGNHSNVIVSNNKLTTKNQGPNLGIYSQNYHAQSYLKIYNNTIDVSGKAGSDPWSLVSGIEVQDTEAEIFGNTITVNNTAGYHAGYHAFGISYCQWTNHTHYYDIQDNTVTVYNGNYAVYLMNDTDVSGIVTENTLITYNGSIVVNTADDAVFANEDYVIKRGNQ